MKVFLYGTLMKGERNNHLLKSSKFIKDIKTTPNFTMYSCTHFPAVIEGGNTSIKGELWWVTERDLIDLDRLESHPNFYVRKQIELENGEKVEAYILPIDILNGCIGSWKENVTGSWRAR